MTSGEGRIKEALLFLASLELPQAQRNDRSALCLLALLDLSPQKAWREARDPLMGVTPIMDWVREHYQKEYAPNTRETFRRQTIHQFMQAGIVVQNPDGPERPVNSPKTVYRIEPSALELARTFGTKAWRKRLARFLSEQETLVARCEESRTESHPRSDRAWNEHHAQPRRTQRADTCDHRRIRPSFRARQRLDLRRRHRGQDWILRHGTLVIAGRRCRHSWEDAGCCSLFP